MKTAIVHCHGLVGVNRFGTLGKDPRHRYYHTSCFFSFLILAPKVRKSWSAIFESTKAEVCLSNELGLNVCVCTGCHLQMKISGKKAACYCSLPIDDPS
jgi:hypothetical protein